MGAETQCWCEPKPAYMSNICADDGGDCLCNGRVIYGQKYPAHEKHEEADEDDSHEG